LPAFAVHWPSWRQICASLQPEALATTQRSPTRVHRPFILQASSGQGDPVAGLDTMISETTTTVATNGNRPQVG